jgi:hypothetical protein
VAEPGQRSRARIVAAVASLLCLAAYCYAFAGLRQTFYTAAGCRLMRDGVVDWASGIRERPAISGVVILGASAVIYCGVRLMRR